jgi:hypothetical protein
MFQSYNEVIAVPVEVTRVGTDHKRAKEAKMLFEEGVWP